MNDFSKNLASNLLAFREKRNWSQMDLAQYLGIPRATVANLESGVANPSLEKVLGISAKLNTSVENLVSRRAPKVRRKKIKLQEGKAHRLGLLKGAELLQLSKDKKVKINKPWEQYRFLLVKGELDILSGGLSYSLMEGDLIEFDDVDQIVLRGVTGKSLVLLSEN
jgi:transcriptional regulator with XRE-family HTH domain